jgi:trehalose/maltose hydrolase-like predicted phosphorylase
METSTLRFSEWDLHEEPLRETLMTLGNGFFASRGASEESTSDEFHYPGTYLAGGYNRVESVVAKRTIENEDLVNWPNWLPLTFRHKGEDWFDLSHVILISYNQELNLKTGELLREIHFKDSKERETKIRSRRIVSMDNPHVAALWWDITSINWSSDIEIKSLIDGSVINSGVKRYRGLTNKHLMIKKKIRLSDSVFLMESMTNHSQLHMAQAIRTIIREAVIIETQHIEDEESVGTIFTVSVIPSQTLSVEKTMALFTSRDHAISHPSYEAERLISRLPDYGGLFNRHCRQWERIWGLCDIDLPGKTRETRLLRFHIFHLLQTVSLKTIDLDVGVPARGLHGEAYRGHIFWDEIFILPYLNLRIPELSRSLLLYRFRRLDEARANAKENGFDGALYPWQSGSNGEEESQIFHLNPLSNRWIPDATHRQRHINAAILYNIWQYYQATEDKDFLSHFGVEMSIEICRFWVSALTFNSTKGKYEILNVVGPDEFHTNYPDSGSSGINNNAYTNFMAAWCIRTTIEMFFSLSHDRQSEILKSLDIDRHELAHWQEISRHIYLPVSEDGILYQFEGFEKLKDLDWSVYRKRYGNIERIDRILESEGDDVNRYKVNKQSDVLMLYYLFSIHDLQSMYQWMGYQFDAESIKKNIIYHLNISSNGSTLSRIVHSWVISKYDINEAWKWFSRSLETDVADLQGGTSHEGIHLGAMAGTVDLVQRCFTGIEVRQDILWINPNMPKDLNEVKFLIHFRGHSLKIAIIDEKIIITIKRGLVQKGKIGINGTIYDLKEGESFEFPIRFRETFGRSINL